MTNHVHSYSNLKKNKDKNNNDNILSDDNTNTKNSGCLKKVYSVTEPRLLTLVITTLL